MNERANHIRASKIEIQTEQSVSTTPVEEHYDPKTFSSLKESRNVGFNTKNEVRLNSITPYQTACSENLSRVIQSDHFFFDESVAWDDNRDNISTGNNLDKDRNCNSNLFLSSPFNLHGGVFSSEVCADGEISSARDQYQSMVEQDEMERVHMKNFLNDNENTPSLSLNMSLNLHQTSEPSVSALHEIPCQTPVGINSANTVGCALEQHNDGVAGTQRTIPKSISQDFSSQAHIQNNEHYEPQQHHSPEQQQQQQAQSMQFATLCLPSSLSACSQSNSPQTTTLTPRNTMSIACYSGGTIPRNKGGNGGNLLNGSTSRPYAHQSFRTSFHDSKSESFNQNRLIFSTHPMENGAHSFDTGKHSNIPKGDGAYQHAHSHSNGNHRFVHHNASSGGNHPASTTTNPLAASSSGHTGSLVPLPSHSYLPYGVNAEPDPHNVMLYTTRENLNGIHPVSGITTTSNPNPNSNVGDPLASTGSLTALRMGPNASNVLIDLNSSQPGVSPQMPPPAARTKLWATEKQSMMAMHPENVGSQCAKSMETSTTGTVAVLRLSSPTQPPPPLCNVAVPQTSSFIAAQTPYSVPNMANIAMITTVDGPCRLMFIPTFHPGGVLCPNFSENHPHPRHGGGGGGDPALHGGMPRDCFVPPPPAPYEGTPSTAPPSPSASMGFSPVSSYTTLSLPSTNYYLLSANTAATTTTGSSRSGSHGVGSPAVDAGAVEGGEGGPREGGPPEPLRKCGNVHHKLSAVTRYIPYYEEGSGGVGSPSLGSPPTPCEAPPPGSPELVTVFFQMFPCELRDRKGIINRVISATCGPDVATVLSVESRSETSFVAAVRTRVGKYLVHKLRCRVLMDRLGFWYADTLPQYVCMKDYCETIRRLPQQNRHLHTEGLPCMPLVVELSRSVGRDCIPSDPAPPCFDQIVPIATVDRHRLRHAIRTNAANGNNNTNSGSNSRHHNAGNGSNPHNSLSHELLRGSK